VRHAHPIDLRQDVVGEIRAEIHPHHAADERQMPKLGKPCAQKVFRCVVRRTHERGIDERAPVLGTEKRDGLDVSIVWVACHVAQEALAARAAGQRTGRQAGEPPFAGHRPRVEPRDLLMRYIPVVPGEELVAAVAREHHRHVSPRELRHVPGRDG
jgi:hypothetical protein